MIETVIMRAMRDTLKMLFADDMITEIVIIHGQQERLTLSKTDNVTLDYPDTGFTLSEERGKLSISYTDISTLLARSNGKEVLHILNFTPAIRLQEMAQQGLNKAVEKYGIPREAVPNPARQFLRGAVFCMKCRKSPCECEADRKESARKMLLAKADKLSW